MAIDATAKSQQVSSQVGNTGAYLMNAGAKQMESYGDRVLNLFDDAKAQNADAYYLDTLREANQLKDGTSQGDMAAASLLDQRLAEADSSRLNLDNLAADFTKERTNLDRDYTFHKGKEDIATFDSILQQKQALATEAAGTVDAAGRAALQVLSADPAMAQNPSLQAQFAAIAPQLSKYTTSDGVFDVVRYKHEHPEVDEQVVDKVATAYKTQFKAITADISSRSANFDRTLMTLSASNPTLANATTLGMGAFNPSVPKNDAAKVQDNRLALEDELKDELVDIGGGEKSWWDGFSTDDEQYNNHVGSIVANTRKALQSARTDRDVTNTQKKQIDFLINAIDQGKIPKSFKSIIMNAIQSDNYDNNFLTNWALGVNDSDLENGVVSEILQKVKSGQYSDDNFAGRPNIFGTETP